MAIKKSDICSSIRTSCDELRGGMDASQYKDYVLFMLFIKYITDKYGNSTDFVPPVAIPSGASFKDMLALRGKSDIGDKNRLREQDIHRIVDIFTRQANVPRYARMERLDAIADPKNDFNLNLPHYINGAEAKIKTLVVDDKWMARISTAVPGELDSVSQTLTVRVEEHLKKIGGTP
jgi:type I restriction-modification system DNA methylase subunit